MGVSPMSLMLFQRRIKEMLYDQGNKITDRLACYYLLDLMDLDTGLIGVHSKISYSGIALNISEKPRQGSKQVPMVIKPHAVRNAVQRLVDAGLFERLSENGKGNLLVLRACVEKVSDEVSHKSQDKKVSRKLAGSYQAESVVNTGLEGGSGNQSFEEVRTYLPSFLPTTHSETKEEKPDLSIDMMSMTLDWEPSESFKKMILDNFKPSDLTMKKVKAAMIDFKLYWLAQDLKMNQAGWEAKLFRNDLKPVLTDGVGRVASVAPERSGKATPKPKTKAKHIRVPEKIFGEILQGWGVRHGFRKVGAGELDSDYRKALCVYINKLNAQAEHKALTGGH